jgi:hypothetical protein
MSDDDSVTLQSQDGQDFKVEVKVAKMSETIKNLIEGGFALELVHVFSLIRLLQTPVWTTRSPCLM